MNNTLNRAASFFSKKSKSLFTKNIRKKFTRQIYVTDIERTNESLIFHFEVEPYINIRMTSQYSAYLICGNKEIKLECLYDKYNIHVELPLSKLNQFHSEIDIQLYSNRDPMIIKRPKNKELLRRFIYDGQLYKITTPKLVKINSEMEHIVFSDDVKMLNSVSASKDTIQLEFKDDILQKDSKVFVFYQYKFVELQNCKVEKNTLTIESFEEISKGQCAFYVRIDDMMYRLEIDTDVDLEFNTEHYLINVNSEENVLIFNVEDHVLKVSDMLIKNVDENIVELNMVFSKHNEKFLKEDSNITSIDTLSLERYTGKCANDRYYVDLRHLVNHFSRKKLTISSEEKEYQIDISEAEITNENEIYYNHHGEVLRIGFYKRKDGYLGFRVRRPSIYRLVKTIDDFTFKGVINNHDRFSHLRQCLIFRDRNSEEDYYIEVDNKFKITPDLNQIINIMSHDKTVIDVYVGFLNHSNEVVRQAKIKYKKSHYKKDNFYSYKVVERENGDEVHLLITTTPFDNLKIEAFVIPNEISLENNKKDYNVWLMGERTDTAQENGIALFKYLLKEKNIKPYYVIDEDSKDFNRVKHLDNVLIFGSLEHFKIAAKAGILLCTHDFENILPYKPAKGIFNYEDTVKVFLQHGVLGRKSAEYHKRYYELPFDLFIVSSDDEKKKIVEDIMGYSSEDVAVTGLARFDDLPFKNKTKDILLMPTWREWINTDEQFLNSQYYHRYLNLITNPRLEKLLEKHDLKLKFYPHYRAQSFFNKEYLNTPERIEFVELGEKTVQDLLVEHSLLITDYSSVSFDFTMMDKPVIYYHFDVGKFFRRGILRPIEETFLGDIAQNEEELIDYIQEAIQDDFKNQVEDVSGILKYRDHNNCKRIVTAVQNKIEEKT